jgi:hypothetical protein
VSGAAFDPYQLSRVLDTRAGNHTLNHDDTQEVHRRSIVAQITMTRAEAAALRDILSSYLSDLRMEIADTDSMQFREGLKGQEALLWKLLEQLDAAVASPDASS